MRDAQESNRGSAVIETAIICDEANTGRIIELVNDAQHRFTLVRDKGWACPSLRFTDLPACELFTTDRKKGVCVSTWQTEGISCYLGWEREALLAACSVLGLVQWRVLCLSPLMIEEDMKHLEPRECLYARQCCRQDYALRFEEALICDGCKEFLCCLGGEPEWFALDEALKFYRSLSSVARKKAVGQPLHRLDPAVCLQADSGAIPGHGTAGAAW